MIQSVGQQTINTSYPRAILIGPQHDIMSKTELENILRRSYVPEPVVPTPQKTNIGDKVSDTIFNVGIVSIFAAGCAGTAYFGSKLINYIKK